MPIRKPRKVVTNLPTEPIPDRGPQLIDILAHEVKVGDDMRWDDMRWGDIHREVTEVMVQANRNRVMIRLDGYLWRTCTYAEAVIIYR